MHLGQDEMNQTLVQNFNSKYFKKDSFWEGVEGNTKSKTGIVGNDETLKSSQYGQLLMQRDGANQQSYSSFNTELTEVMNEQDIKRDTIHHDFGQRNNALNDSIAKKQRTEQVPAQIDDANFQVAM